MSRHAARTRSGSGRTSLYDEIATKIIAELEASRVSALLKDRAASEAAFHNCYLRDTFATTIFRCARRTGTIREVEFVSAVYHEDGERIVRCNIRDIAERRQAQEHQLLLTAELDHRVRNTLSGVMAIARQTTRHSASWPIFADPSRSG